MSRRACEGRHRGIIADGEGRVNTIVILLNALGKVIASLSGIVIQV